MITTELPIEKPTFIIVALTTASAWLASASLCIIGLRAAIGATWEAYWVAMTLSCVLFAVDLIREVVEVARMPDEVLAREGRHE